MLFGFVTAFLTCSPLTTIVSRIIMCVAVTKHYNNVTDVTTLAIDDVTIPMTSQPLSEDGDLTTTSRRGRGQSLVPGVYDYESSINFDRYLQVKHSIKEDSVIYSVFFQLVKMAIKFTVLDKISSSQLKYLIK